MNQVIADIYKASASQGSWSTVLTHITTELDLLGCQMIGVSTESGSVLFSHASDGAPGDVELDYVRKYHVSDPRVPLVLGRGAGVWTFDQDVFEPDLLASNPFYADLLVPYGGQFSASSKLAAHDGEVVLLACLSRYGDVGFDEHRRQYLSTLAWHLCEGAAIYLRSRHMAARAGFGTELLQRMGRPALLLGMDRSVNFMNAAARRFVSESHTVSLSGDRLHALQPGNEAALARAFDTMASVIAEKPMAGRDMTRHALRMGARQGPAEVVLTLTPFAPDRSMHAFGTQPCVLAVVHAHGTNALPDMMLWEVAFDLTPAQARVGLALYQGKTVDQAAAALHVSATTIKSHLKELFRKTGTRGQAELALALGALQV